MRSVFILFYFSFCWSNYKNKCFFFLRAKKNHSRASIAAVKEKLQKHNKVEMVGKMAITKHGK